MISYVKTWQLFPSWFPCFLPLCHLSLMHSAICSFSPHFRRSPTHRNLPGMVFLERTKSNQLVLALKARHNLNLFYPSTFSFQFVSNVDLHCSFTWIQSCLLTFILWFPHWNAFPGPFYLLTFAHDFGAQLFCKPYLFLNIDWLLPVVLHLLGFNLELY